jgi:methylmalonyl-CoA/ethylmalonyl-CoA epimerase
MNNLGLPLDHLGIATPDLETGSAPYRALGLEPDGPDETVESQRVRVRAFRAGETLIELLAPTTPDSPITTFLEKRGPGLHHAAFRVHDLEAQIVRLQALGATLLSPEPRPGRAGTRVVFLHPRWGAGVLIELCEHPIEHPVEPPPGASR